MTNEEFNGLKVGDTVVTATELRFDGRSFPEGTEIVITYIIPYSNNIDGAGVVYGLVKGVNREIRFHYTDLEICKDEEPSNTPQTDEVSKVQMSGMTYAEAIEFVRFKETDSDLYLAVDINSLSAMEFLNLTSNPYMFIQVRK